MNPLVSVIIPTFNRKDKLLEAVNSLKKQAYKPIEIIVIDRGLSPAASRNLGAKDAKSEYIFFTDDDCIIPENLIEDYMYLMKAHPEAAGIGGNLIPGEKTIVSSIETMISNILKINYKQIEIKRNAFIFTHGCLYKRSVFNEFGGFDERYHAPAGEDSEFSSRVSGKYPLILTPLEVIHNNKYDINYLIGIIFKRGLDRMPPDENENPFRIMLEIIINLPLLAYNSFKKILKYRNQHEMV